jgi:hypothetical protein
MDCEILAKIYLLEIKIVRSSSDAKVRKETRGGNVKVSLAMLLKTNVEKMSENRSLAMLMKPKELKSLSGDVDEKKWG